MITARCSRCQFKGDYKNSIETRDAMMEHTKLEHSRAGHMRLVPGWYQRDLRKTEIPDPHGVAR